MTVLRVLFVVTVVYFGWSSLRGEWPAVLAALVQVSASRLLAAGALVVVGLVCTGVVWQRILAGYGHPLPARSGLPVFFVGQLGKYIPGSVWSLAAQGQMARRFQVPVRTTVATGLIFLYWNVVTATLLSAALTLAGHLSLDVPTWVSGGAGLLALGAMAPIIVTTLANWLAGTSTPCHTRWRDTGVLAPLMLATWTAYGTALLSVAPDGQSSGFADLAVTTAIAAFTIAYVVGVLVPLAPAGFGVREVTLTYLLSPILGLPGAAATALLTRAIHTIADFGIAGVSWLVGHDVRRHSPRARGTLPKPHSH